MAFVSRYRCWLIAAVVAIVPACAKVEDQSIRFGLAAEPVTLDPRFATDAASYRICRLIYESLVDFDEAARPIPALATWEPLSPTHYRFRLNNQRRFHDGSRLTAADVKATYDFILERANASPHRGSLASIIQITVVADDVVDFEIDKPDVLFPGRLVIGILPKRLIEAQHPFNTRPVGSGAMALVDWSAEGGLQLRRLSDGQLIGFDTVVDPTVRVLKLIRGEIDIIQGDLPHELIDWLAEHPMARVARARGNTFSYLGFNLKDPVLAKAEVRQAIAYALDRRPILKYVMAGMARPASAIFPGDHWAGNPDLPLYQRDIGRARELLRQAGYTALHPLRLSYKTSNNPFRVRLATIFQHQLQEAGIEVAVQSYDWGTFYGDITAGRFQMFSLSWVGLKMPDIFRYVFHSRAVPPDGANRGSYNNPRADRLIEHAETAADAGAMADRYRHLQALLLEDLPYVPLWYEDNVAATRLNISGYTVSADGNYDSLQQVKREAP